MSNLTNEELSSDASKDGEELQRQLESLTNKEEKEKQKVESDVTLSKERET